MALLPSTTRRELFTVVPSPASMIFETPSAAHARDNWLSAMKKCSFRSGALILTLAFLPLLLAIPAFAATQDIGTVIAITPGASVLRDGATEPLALQSGIRVSDTIRTDASGRVHILFNDDSSVSLGSDTSMDMAEYADAGSSSAFGVHMSQGLVRVITGKIVDQNPGGFRMATPEATVGIRGTIVSMQRRGKRTTVYVENTLRQVHVNNVNIPSGFKVILEDDALWQEPINPQDRRELGRGLAFRGGKGSAAAAPEPGVDDGYTTTDPLLSSLGDIPGNSELQNIPLNTQTLGNTLMPSLTGTVSGTVNTAMNGGVPISFTASSWGFNVNLTSGAISNGYLNLSDSGAFGASFTGGTGTANASGFNFTAGGTITSGVPHLDGLLSVSSNATMDLLSAPSGTGVGIDYSANSSTGGVTYTGTGIGTFTK